MSAFFARVRIMVIGRRRVVMNLSNHLRSPCAAFSCRDYPPHVESRSNQDPSERNDPRVVNYAWGPFGERRDAMRRSSGAWNNYIRRATWLIPLGPTDFPFGRGGWCLFKSLCQSGCSTDPVTNWILERIWNKGLVIPNNVFKIFPLFSNRRDMLTENHLILCLIILH